jgi:hypothetical protein
MQGSLGGCMLRMERLLACCLLSASAALLRGLRGPGLSPPLPEAVS